MDINEYIASGILEQYVAGTLSQKENEEVHAMLLKYPEIKKEVEAIEKAVLELTASVAPLKSVPFQNLEKKLNLQKSTTQKPVRRINWTTYTGWAASIVLGIGLSYMYYQNDALKNQIQTIDTENQTLEQQIVDAKDNADELLKVFRGKDIVSVALGGQKVAPDAYAKAFWNKAEDKVYIDAAGLPEPPEGKVYQVWSLTLDPLTPTSLGLLSDFELDENKVFALANPNQSQAFGITLEPAGGSKSPTLEQLYTLGVVDSKS